MGISDKGTSIRIVSRLVCYAYVHKYNSRKTKDEDQEDMGQSAGKGSIWEPSNCTNCDYKNSKKLITFLATAVLTVVLNYLQNIRKENGQKQCRR